MRLGSIEFDGRAPCASFNEVIGAERICRRCFKLYIFSVVYHDTLYTVPVSFPIPSHVTLLFFLDLLAKKKKKIYSLSMKLMPKFKSKIIRNLKHWWRNNRER